MTPYSIVPFFSILAICWAVAELIARVVPFYRRELAPSGPRYPILDGLRGFLALPVFLLHSSINYFYFRTGDWQPTSALFYSQAGQIGVICFFMITGFLFWGKAIDSNLRVRFIPLLHNRVRRLAPLFWFSSVLVLMIVLLATGLEIRGSLKDSIVWLIGAATVQIVPPPATLNGLNVVPINAGVVWTLTLEWFFYLTLPLTGRLATPGRVWFIAVPVVILAILLPPGALLLHFVFGMLTAHLVRRWDWRSLATTRWFAIVPVAATALVTLTGPLPLLNGVSSLLVFVAFASFAYGNDLFGLLRTRGARMLSAASYSIYLLHGILLYLTLHSIDRFTPIVKLSDAAYWFVIAGVGICVVLVSATTFALIEYPFMKKRKPTESPATSDAEVSGLAAAVP